MIDETEIRAAFESVLGLLPDQNVGEFLGLPVTRVAETVGQQGPHIRVYMVREQRHELYRGIRRIPGMFGALVHVPAGDGIAAAEAIAKQIPPLYRASETGNAKLAGFITIREVSLMSPYRGVDVARDDAPQWIVSPVQIDWRVDVTAKP